MSTITDVAKRAGVSPTTVSHVLSGKRPVADETRRRVESVIEELGFRPNALATSLRTQRSQTVALIIPDITNPYYPMVSRGLQDALSAEKYLIFLCNTDEQRNQELVYLADAVQRQVDGIVLVAFQCDTTDLRPVLDAQVPIILIGDDLIHHPQIDVVMTDDQRGAYDATMYLIERGHQRIGMLCGPPAFFPGIKRTRGYQEALANAGLTFDPTCCVQEAFTREGGAAGMRQLMALAERPSAVFCANDLMAIGALDVTRELGLSVPEEVAIIGYDDIDAASLVAPALTTVLNPAYAIGHNVGQLLIERMTGTYAGPQRRVVVPHHLIRRASA